MEMGSTLSIWILEEPTLYSVGGDDQLIESVILDCRSNTAAALLLHGGWASVAGSDKELNNNFLGPHDII